MQIGDEVRVSFTLLSAKSWILGLQFRVTISYKGYADTLLSIDHVIVLRMPTGFF